MLVMAGRYPQTRLPWGSFANNEKTYTSSLKMTNLVGYTQSFILHEDWSAGRCDDVVDSALVRLGLIRRFHVSASHQIRLSCLEGEWHKGHVEVESHQLLRRRLRRP